MYVVVDSTEFYSNRLLEGVDIEIINVHIQRAQGALLIPQVVIDEAVKKQRADLRERHAQLTKELQAFERLYRHGDPTWTPPSLDVDLDRALESYRNDLMIRMRGLRAIILPYEAIPLGPLVVRAMECRKPFDAKGQRGFRDAVIWASVLHFLRRSAETCYLVTNNKNDFCDSNGLHPDLQEDLRALELSPALVQVTDSLSSLALTLGGGVRPTNLPYTSIRPQFGLFDVQEFLMENWEEFADMLWQYAKESRARFERVLSIKVYSTPSFDSTVYDPEDVRIYAVDRAAVEGCLKVRLTTTFIGDSQVLLAKDDLVEILRDPHPSLSRLRATRVYATIPIEGSLDIEVVLDPKTGEVEGGQILRCGITPDLGDSILA